MTRTGRRWYAHQNGARFGVRTSVLFFVSQEWRAVSVVVRGRLEEIDKRSVASIRSSLTRYEPTRDRTVFYGYADRRLARAVIYKCFSSTERDLEG